MNSDGAVSLIHPESALHRREGRATASKPSYERQRRHWQFINELELFEIDHHKDYGIHVYGTRQVPKFLNASSLYHPDTVIRSLVHDGSGQAPGLKDADGQWDLRPHANRIITITDEVLQSWKDVLEAAEVPVRQTRMVYTVNRLVSTVLEKLSAAPRIGSLNPQFSQGWNETTDFTKGYFIKEWGVPNSWDDVILQGPHLHVATPLYKSPRKTLKSNKDWSATDFEALVDDAIPATAYKPVGVRERYDANYTSWQVPNDDGIIQTVRARDCYRIAWRRMAANTGERTLVPAVIPPGTAHMHLVYSACLPVRSLRRWPSSSAGSLDAV